MYLTISKRFEFSSSRCYGNPVWSPEKNFSLYGKDATAQNGTGQNYVAHFVFHGPVTAKTGMVINVVDIKQRVGEIIDSRFDHKFLNVDTSPFDQILPTPENLAVRLLQETVPLFKDEPAQPVVCHLEETPWREATAYVDGSVESHHSLEFSAARRTFSPHLSDEENTRLFGIAASPSGHGHRYLMRVTLKDAVDGQTGMIVPDQHCGRILKELHHTFDHRHLNLDVSALNGIPMTTECLARHFFDRISKDLPVDRVRLEETSDFFAEYHSKTGYRIGVADTFSAAHRLHSPHLNDQQNLDIYGKCNNPHGHGHLYRVEATAAGGLDEKSGTIGSLPALQDGVSGALVLWDHKHLNRDTEDFADLISTSENIVSVLWPRIDNNLEGTLWRLRLWETPNNRFTLRRKLG